MSEPQQTGPKRKSKDPIGTSADGAATETSGLAAKQQSDDGAEIKPIGDSIDAERRFAGMAVMTFGGGFGAALVIHAFVWLGRLRREVVSAEGLDPEQVNLIIAIATAHGVISLGVVAGVVRTFQIGERLTLPAHLHARIETSRAGRAGAAVRHVRSMLDALSSAVKDLRP